MIRLSIPRIILNELDLRALNPTRAIKQRIRADMRRVLSAEINQRPCPSHRSLLILNK